MKLKLILAAFFSAVVLAACSSANTDDGQSSAAKEDTSNVKQLVQDYSSGAKKAQNASITSKQLIVIDNGGSEKAYDLPKGEFFVSMAPYIKNTHP